MKALFIHLLIVASTIIGGDLTFNNGRDSQALYNEMMPHALVNDGKRAAYHFSADISGFLGPALNRR